MLKPPTLKKGHTIGLISPSAPMAAKISHRVDKGIEALKKLGFDIKIAQNALNATGYTAGSAKERADDIHDLFRDSSVKAIISFIGGFHSNQILEYLDFGLIKNNPKIFMGYSDVTVLHWAMHTKADLVTFYGPAIITQFGENPTVLPYTKEYFEKAVMSGKPIGKVEPSTEWTDEILNWFEKKDLERPRQLKKNPGFEWLKEGKTEGKIIGGCITSLLHLRGTEYWPDFQDTIFFWELAESSADFAKGEPVSRIDAHLTDLELSGVFKKIKGMIIGRPFGYSDEETNNLKKLILERTKKYNFPILYGIDIGHSDPLMTIPLGVNAAINSEKNSFEITEAATI